MKDIKNLTDEEAVVLLYKLLGYEVRPWTESQQVAYLLGILQCPEGHILAGDSTEPQELTEERTRWISYEVFPDIIFKQFIDSDGLACEEDSGEETREFQDSSKWTVLTCNGRDHEHSSLFYIPPQILVDLKKVLPS